MNRQNSLIVFVTAACLVLPGWYSAAGLAQQITRHIPMPASDHPGNVFVAGQEVSVKVATNLVHKAVRWRAMDDRGGIVGQGQIDSDNIKIGDPGIGWYRIEFLGEGGEVVGWTTAAVLAPLAEPTPEDSPICADSATAWFARNKPKMQADFSSLAALAGVNWVRDRMTWGELEPERDNFNSKRTTYDMAADIQKEYGLKVLQVFHGTPGWAQDKNLDGERAPGRFPRDLRDAYRFCRQMAVRYKGRIDAWEPWNEANIDMFGGHTVDEMCSYQKAAYLGFKAGDPDVTVGWNVYTTLPTKEHTDGLLANEVYPYFDTYNIHTYEWAHDYADLWGEARRAAGAKQLWITEADRGLKYIPDEPGHELSREDELHKARYIPQSYASSLWAGSSRHFHFILGNYSEEFNGVQFGLLRKDMTPRPGYVALAAVGRLLARARCLGRLIDPEHPDANIYVFRARPDGVERDVVVAWAEGKFDWPQRGKMSMDWPMKEKWNADEVYDYLGRKVDSIPDQLTSTAVYILLAPGKTEGLELKNVEPAKQLGGDVCPVVLQVQMPRKNSMKVEPKPWSQGYEYRIAPGKAFRLKMYAYNFASAKAVGTVELNSMPAGWTVSRKRWPLEIEAMGRQLFEADLVIPDEQDGSIGIVGDFGALGRPMLSFRIHGKADE
jgi:hypothetical protein